MHCSVRVESLLGGWVISELLRSELLLLIPWLNSICTRQDLLARGTQQSSGGLLLKASNVFKRQIQPDHGHRDMAVTL